MRSEPGYFSGKPLDECLEIFRANTQSAGPAARVMMDTGWIAGVQATISRLVYEAEKGGQRLAAEEILAHVQRLAKELPARIEKAAFPPNN